MTGKVDTSGEDEVEEDWQRGDKGDIHYSL